MTDLSLPPAVREVHNRCIPPVLRGAHSYGIKETNPYNKKLFEDRIIFSACRSTTRRPTTMAQLLTLESNEPDRDIIM